MIFLLFCWYLSDWLLSSYLIGTDMLNLDSAYVLYTVQTPTLGHAHAFNIMQRLNPIWVIKVAHYGSFLFQGSEAKAEEMRVHKANWEQAIAHKRLASITDLPLPSDCWNHPGFSRLYWYGSRGRRLKRPWVPIFSCDCKNCDI